MKIINIKKKVVVDHSIPDGFYRGIWGGTCITLTVDGAEYELTTEEGVRGGGFPVVVTVISGIATFKELNKQQFRI